jgi:hypothetical protein
MVAVREKLQAAETRSVPGECRRKVTKRGIINALSASLLSAAGNREQHDQIS